jgi:competence protein ComFC
MDEMQWIVGKTCACCGKALDDAYTSELCYDCKRGGRHIFNHGISAVTYNQTATRIIAEMKYKDKPYVAKHIAEIIYARLTALDEEYLRSVDLIVPVPMNIKKERIRGYNQAGLIAEHLSELTGIDCETNILKRTKETKVMSSLSLGERLLSLSGAFDIDERQVSKLTEKNLILVDDVMTTGSTADACAEILLSNGASKVDLCTFASGVNLNYLEK